MTFFKELRRRNVVKVASVYLVTTWLILQVVSVVAPALHLPTVFSTIVTLVLVLGFPIVCIFAWAFELTPQGLKLTRDVHESESISQQTGSAMNKYLASGLVLALGFIAFDKMYLEARETATVRSIAVLPFEDMSPDRSQEYFGDGIAEEILNALTRIEDMTVISRTSSFRYKGSEHDIRTIGKELDVNYVLEGSVRKDKNQLRITAQLIDVASGAHIWSQTYDRTPSSIFALQDELTFAITQALQLNLMPDDVPTAVGMTTNSDAYSLFVEARELIYQRNSDAIQRAILLFEEALQLDTHFHLARAQLFFAYNMAAEYGGVDIDTIERVQTQLFWSLLAAPDFPHKLLVFAQQAMTKGESEVYWPLLTKAYEAAPHDPLIQNVYLLYLDDINATIDVREKLLTTNPASQINYVNLNELYLINGQLDEALALEKKMQQEFGDSLQLLWMKLQRVYSYEHDVQQAARLISTFSGDKSSSIRSLEISTQLFLGNVDRALAIMHEHLSRYPHEFDWYSYSYIGLLQLQQKNQLTESQEVALQTLPVSDEGIKELHAWWAYLRGDHAGFEAAHSLASVTQKELIEKLRSEPELALQYMTLKQPQQGTALYEAALPPLRKVAEFACKHNLVGAVSSWCESYFSITGENHSQERLVSQRDAVRYWSIYDAGHEAFMLTDPAYQSLRASPEGTAYLQAMLNTSIEQTNPELITRKGLQQGP